MFILPLKLVSLPQWRWTTRFLTTFLNELGFALTFFGNLSARWQQILSGVPPRYHNTTLYWTIVAFFKKGVGGRGLLKIPGCGMKGELNPHTPWNQNTSHCFQNDTPEWTWWVCVRSGFAGFLPPSKKHTGKAGRGHPIVHDFDLCID